MLNLIVMMSQPIFKGGILKRYNASFAIKNVSLNQDLDIEKVNRSYFELFISVLRNGCRPVNGKRKKKT